MPRYTKQQMWASMTNPGMPAPMYKAWLHHTKAAKKIAQELRMLDLIGKKIGMLTVVDKRPRWTCTICRCDCGVEVPVRLADFLRRDKYSCGCVRPNWNKNRNLPV